MPDLLRAVFATACCVLLSIGAQAQASLSPATRLMLSDMQAALAGGDRAAVERAAMLHDLQWQHGAWQAGVVALVDDESFDEERLAPSGARLNSRMTGLVTLRVPFDRLVQLAAVPGIRYLDIGGSASPDLQHSRIDTRVDSVNDGLGGLPMAYRGSGVIVAVLDWGFDYTHPVFRDSAFTALRIARAWDQNKLSGPAPAGFDHGTEYAGTDALLAAGSDTTYVFGPNSHGTHVAGIAAGNGAGTVHKGMAPEAELVLVSLRRTDQSFIDAINYVRQYAESVGKPFVVNMSFGQHMGPHDGSMPREQAIAQMAGPGRVFVGSAGNNGTGAFHLRHMFSGTGDTARTVVGFGNVENYWGQALSVWGSPGGAFRIGLLFVNGNGSIAHSTDLLHTADDPLVNDTVVIAAGDTLYVRLAGEAASPHNGRPGVVVEVRRTVPHKVVLQLTAEEGEVHVWNVMRLNNRTTNWGVDLSNDHPGALAGDNQYGIGEPGVGHQVITVASHRAGQLSVGGTPIYGALSGFSSRGPTVDGRTKPDICAPGQSVRSSVSSFDPTTAGVPITVQFEGTTYPFDVYSGTSMSGPAVAGVVALMLQAVPWLHADDAKEILKGTARLDTHTGSIGPEGNLSWGWGKVNALAAIRSLVDLVGVPSHGSEHGSLLLYPNPAQDLLHVQGVAFQRVRVFSMMGQLVLEHVAQVPGSGHIPVGALAPGTYLVQVIGDKGIGYGRFVRH
jgi:minor extracellular serine protease Vpr